MYLSPHLNPRSVLTASNIQVRYPISSKSIDGWKNYKDMLKPSIEILAQTDRYEDITSWKIGKIWREIFKDIWRNLLVHDS